MAAQTISMPVARATPSAPPRQLQALDVESIRVAHERTFAATVMQHPFAKTVLARISPLSAKDERRHLMANSLRLSEGMAPEAYQLAHQAQQILGISGTLELYQRRGPENAAMHMVAEPILLEIHGALLPRLDHGALMALFGHELGHYLAHGATSPHQAALRVPCGVTDDAVLEAALSRFSMACELTADRIALLACQDLAALLRLNLVSVSGLAVGELTYDTDAYLAQCKDLIEEDLRTGELAHGNTHPEHGLRVYAAWLFSETRTYRELTGRGPGTRELGEVDEIIGRCLGASDQPIHDPVQTGHVPRELLECALAAAVLIASCDGDITEDEQLLLERTFATSIADWQTYLDPQVAIRRFVESATVLAPIADEIGPVLLNLLFAVMIADGAIERVEISMVLEIGEVLGVRDRFERALTAMLRHGGVDVSFDDLEPPEQPLPVRKADAEQALDTFLAGVLRRGESTITLRRLLRMLGSDARDESLVARLGHVIGQRRIAATPPLAQAGLDDRIVLAPTAPAAPKPAPAAALPASRKGLMDALRRLREQLVSGDGRSPSVRLRSVRRGRAFDLAALERVSVGSAERVMAQVRARRAVRVVDAADAGRHGPAATVAAEMLALLREDTERTEETGARDLYVGYPFLTGNAGGYFVRAPLVLYPVEIARDGAGARGFRLEPRRDELPIANQSLIRLVFNKRGYSFSDDLADELEALAGDPDGGPEAVRRRLAEVGLATADGASALQPFGEADETRISGERMVIEEAAVLGLFPQSSSDLLQDYDGLLQDLAKPGTDVTELLAAAATLLPDRLAPSSDVGAGDVGNDWAPVIPADPSQRSVITEARRHGATVIDGPPGTGKSQVIVNLVAEAVRRGERVAVVCEKRAALDVVRQRMSAIGFGKALAVVHDVYEDRKELFAHITKRLEATGRVPFTAAEAEAVRSEHARVHGALTARAVALQSTPAGLDLTVGELLTYTAQHAAPALPAITGLDRLAQADVRSLGEIAVALRPLVDVWAPDGRWRGPRGLPRRSLAGAGPTRVRDVELAIERTIAVAETFARHIAATPAGISLDRIDAARAGLDAAIATRRARAHDRDRALFVTVVQLAAHAPERLRELDLAHAALRDSATALTRIERPVTFEGGPELTAALSVLSRWTGAWHRVFVIGWWQARKRLRAELTRLWPERAGDALTTTLLGDVRDRVAASRAWRTIGDVFARLGLAHALPTTSAELAPAIERVSSLADNLRDLAAARDRLVAIGAWLPESPDGAPDDASLAAWDQVVDARLALLRARDELAAASTALTHWFPSLQALPPVAGLRSLLELWRRDGAHLAECDDLLARATALVPGAAQLLDAAATTWREQPDTVWRERITAAWAAAWRARLEREQPILATLGHGADDREVERLAARLRELETERRELEIERTLARLDDAELLKVEAAAKGARRTPQQKQREELLKEARKQRMLMPLRTFVRRFAPAGLLDVAPVWLLSPETMAILFPRQPLFDLVVFDEASQCTVEAGLPVLLRARRVVIAGDEKQMPPSSYFALGGSGDDDEATSAGVEPDEQRDTVRDLLTAESLLSLARPRVAHTGLTWHYRCQDEALIAFSNHAMYQGELLSIPSTAGTAARSALHWVPVANGVYNAGENAPEAAKVVDVLDELLARSPRPTVGVVTFNLRQRKAVLDAIDARRASDDAFSVRWAEASALPLDERPFVRNLEQVQGDERDVIVFSLGHAPQVRTRGGVATGETYVPARFGPLGQRGGERRLNVAISRAKQACHIVASFDPQQLTVATAKHQGPRLFKHFLEFAHHHHHGRRLEAARVLDLVRSTSRAEVAVRHRLPLDGFTPLATQLALAFEAAGIPYETDVGASGFRIPLAVLDPADPTRYALAILLQDGRGGADPFDLHVHRPGVLRQRGWKVLSISAASWARRGPELLTDIETLVPGARGAVTSDVYRRHREALARLAPPPRTGPMRSKTPGTSQPDLFSRAGGTEPSGSAPGPSVLHNAGTQVDLFGRRGTAPASAPEATPTAVPEATSDATSASGGRRRESAPVPELPAWATVTDDDLFRTALLHLERHGLLNESDLTNLVGGPRRARVFARELDGWLPGLPFHIEVSVIEGAKAYKKVARA